MKTKTEITIVGFGRFGQTLYRLLKDDFKIVIFNRSRLDRMKLGLEQTTVIANTVEQAYLSDIIFYAVPIDQFEAVIKSHLKHIRPNQTMIDVLSVKVHPKEVFNKHLKTSSQQILLTHPMFGPDSSKNGFTNLPIVIDKFRMDDKNYHLWKDFFQSKGLRVVEMTAKKHDKLAANSQGLTHFVGRLLEQYKLMPTLIDSLGTQKLLEVKDQTCHDTKQLFLNLQQFNPYTRQMRIKLGKSYDKLYNQLLPRQVKRGWLTVGIQGGKGSFNEEALHDYLNRHQINKFKTKYLFTSENVLKALHKGEIDAGLFAIHNSIGGIVGESVNAMSKYNFQIVEEFAIKISHALMIRSDTKIKEITTIMTHPQVFAQCKSNLQIKFSNLKIVSGKGELVDHAKVAKLLSEKKLDKNIAVMGSKMLADLYDLNIIEENLQDLSENFTSFMLIKRRNH